MLKIGVLGSCVSRDNFYSKFVVNYKDYYECVMHQNQMSIISLMAEGIDFEYSLLNNLNDFEKKQFITEMDKSFWKTLIVNSPDYLIVDFYGDVRFGVVQIDNSYITNKDFVFKKTNLYSKLNKKKILNLTQNPEEYIRLWKKSIDNFITKINNILPSCKIIINRARFVDEYIETKTNTLKKISTSGKQIYIDVHEYNNWLEYFENYLIENYNVKTIDYGDFPYKAIDNHLWGLYYLHYEAKFYTDFTNKLIKIIIDDYVNQQETILKLNDKKHKCLNLLINGDFQKGNKHWSYWDKNFIINENNTLTINKYDLDKEEYNQIWSNAMEINADNRKVFRISFDIKIKDIRKLDGNRNIFCIRTFKQIDKVWHVDSVWNQFININEIPNIKDNKWIRYSVEISPIIGKFIKVSPYISKNGNVSWKNICVEYVGVK